MKLPSPVAQALEGKATLKGVDYFAPNLMMAEATGSSDELIAKRSRILAGVQGAMLSGPSWLLSQCPAQQPQAPWALRSQRRRRARLPPLRAPLIGWHVSVQATSGHTRKAVLVARAAASPYA